MNPIDAIWELLGEGEYYSPNDVASMLNCPTEAVARVLEFLVKYRFLRRVAPELFAKIPNTPSPKDALNVLLTMVEEPSKQATQPLSRGNFQNER